MPPAREEAAYVVAHIPGARGFEVPGPDYAIYLQGETLVPELERFVTTLETEEPETTLATVLLHGHRGLDGEGGRARRCPVARAR
jgi:hypothetical protein